MHILKRIRLCTKLITCLVTDTTFWRRSFTPYSHFSCKSFNVLRVIRLTVILTVHDCIFLQYLRFFSLSQLRATRAVSRHSVPIIAWAVAGTVPIFGPESTGGIGDIGTRIDAEAAHTRLSADVMGSTVNIS